MVQVVRADLVGKLDQIGQLQFLRVEWWGEAPRFALLRYSINDHEEALGIRLDLDKKAVLDSVANIFLDEAIRKNVDTIWKVVVAEQASSGT
jgi:hypothetical protein